MFRHIMSIAISLSKIMFSSGIFALNRNDGIECSLQTSHASEILSSSHFVSCLTFPGYDLFL